MGIKGNKKAFTIVELIVVATIIIILTTIGFYTYSKHNLIARDTKRKMDLVELESSLKLYKRINGVYPLPGNLFTLTNGGAEIAYQGKMDSNVSLTTLNSLPLDPKLNIPYIYSITQNKREFQVATTLENNGRPISFLVGNYVPVSKNIFPSLILALDSFSSVDITDTDIQERFVINGTSYNLPYTLDSGEAYTSKTPLSAILEEVQTNEQYWQNIDYRNCKEIEDAGKAIGNGEYQIYSEGGSIQTVNCVFDGALTSTGVCLNLPDYADWTATQFYTKTFNGINYVPIEKFAQYNTSSVDGNCYFDCDPGHAWNGSICKPNDCIASTQTVNSHDYSVPNFNHGTNTTQNSIITILNGTRTFEQTFSCNTGTVLPSGSETNTANNCDLGYNWDSGTSTCTENYCKFGDSNYPCDFKIPSSGDTKTSVCSGVIPTNASATTSNAFTQTHDGANWIPLTLTRGENQSECDFDCDSGYHWNGSTCESNTRLFICNAKPATGTIWNSVIYYTQTWNGSSWSPADSTTSYNATPSTTSCRYDCDSGYSWDGDNCEIDLITINISSNTTNLDLRTKYDTLYPFTPPTSGMNIKFVVDSGVIVGSTSTSSVALNVGTWPAGVNLELENNGYIVGGGGAGGDGGDASHPEGYPGEKGGDAMYTRADITIINNGIISVGAGGGGGGGALYYPGVWIIPPNLRSLGAGGGGGAGYWSGDGGAGCNYGEDGGTYYGGDYGASIYADDTDRSGRGGYGGELGYDGEDGQKSYNDDSDIDERNGGAGGEAGDYAIDGDSYVNWSTLGDVRGSRIN